MHFHHKKIAVLAANVLTIVFVFLLFSFQGNAEAQNAPDAPMVMGSVAGHVTDDVGLPLAGITVTLYRDSSTFYKNAQTDANGNYRIDGVITGNYVVKFGKENSFYVTQYYKDSKNAEGAQSIALVGNEITGIDAVLILGGRISGKISLAPPITSEFVKLSLLHYVVSNATWAKIDEIEMYLSSTDSSEGRPFLFTDLPTGTYAIEVYADDGFSGAETYREYYDNALELTQATTITVAASLETTGIAIVVGENPNLVSISGMVTSDSGLPLGSIFVNLSGTTFGGVRNVRYTFTESDGSYYFNTFPPGDYRVFFSDIYQKYVDEPYRDPASATDPEKLNLITGTIRNDINVQLSPTGQISGTVRFFDGTVPESAIVYAYRADQQDGSAVAHHFDRIDNDSVVRYRIEEVDPGEYYVLVEAKYQGSKVSEFYGNALQKEQAQKVTVRSGKVTPNIDLILGDAVAVSHIFGNVRNVAGEPSADVVVSTFVSGTTPFGFAEIKTSATGDFHFPIFIPGDYVVRFEGYEQGYVSPYYYPNSLDFSNAQPLRVAAGATITNINMVLPSAAEISGSISFYNGTAPGGALIFLYQLDGESWMEKDFRMFLLEDQANQLHYRIRGLTPGQYRIGAFIDKYPLQFYANHPTLESATTITLDHGLAISNVNFIFGQDVANATIQGKVTTDGGIPTDVRVEVYKEGESGYYNLLVHLPPNDDGSFKIAGLNSGRYRVALRYGGTDGYNATRIYWHNAQDSDKSTTISLSDTTTFSDVTFNFYRVHLPIISR